MARNGSDEIRISTEALGDIHNRVKQVEAGIRAQQSAVNSVLGHLDQVSGADVRFDLNLRMSRGGTFSGSDIKSALSACRGALNACERETNRLSRAVDHTRTDFEATESALKASFEALFAGDASEFSGAGSTGSNGSHNTGSPNTSGDGWFGDTTIGFPHILPLIGSLVTPFSGLLYITSGIPVGNVPSFFDHSRTPSSHAYGDWLGYEFAEGNPGVTAWLGKVSAGAQNEWGYAGVNAYVGKVEAGIDSDFSFMKTTTKKEYKDGKWVEKTVTSFVNAGLSAGASASVVAADAEAGLGSDMLGIEGKAEGAAGVANLKGEAQFSVSEDGVDAKLEGEAMVAAVKGEASGTINILGLEITAKVGGYAGAAGVEGKVGIEDNKFVMEGGAAALIGGSVGFEIGFNDEGWDNFVDFVTFWD